MVNSKNEVSWQFIKLKRTEWENTEPENESALTFAAHKSLLALLTLIQPIVESHIGHDYQNVKGFKIVDKSMGGIFLQWYSTYFELDIDIQDTGEIDYLICRVGDPQELWSSGEGKEVEEVVSALKGYL